MKPYHAAAGGDFALLRRDKYSRDTDCRFHFWCCSKYHFSLSKVCPLLSSDAVGGERVNREHYSPRHPRVDLLSLTSGRCAVQLMSLDRLLVPQREVTGNPTVFWAAQPCDSRWRSGHMVVCIENARRYCQLKRWPVPVASYFSDIYGRIQGPQKLKVAGIW